ncbi:unnamed protein product, partial [Ectocarpus sp. 13 AM-2016]
YEQEVYDRVGRWDKTVDLFTKKFVLVPVVQNDHWSLACLCNLDTVKVLPEISSDSTVII